MVDDWRSMLQAIFLPARCILCGDRGQGRTLDLCAPCQADLPRNARGCRVCAEPLAESALPPASMGALPPLLETCPRCAARPPYFDRAIVPYLYAYPVDRLVQRLKYEGAMVFGRVLGMLLAAALSAPPGDARAGATRGVADLPQALVPVPLHVARHRERGFNQALEIARPIGRSLRIPIDDRLCRRVRSTADQTGLLASQRRRNLRRAFAVVRTPQWTHVALIDDVLTTGSTTGELARALQRAGVQKVDVWAVARAARASGAHTRSAGRRS